MARMKEKYIEEQQRVTSDDPTAPDYYDDDKWLDDQYQYKEHCKEQAELQAQEEQEKKVLIERINLEEEERSKNRLSTVMEQTKRFLSKTYKNIKKTKFAKF